MNSSKIISTTEELNTGISSLSKSRNVLLMDKNTELYCLPVFLKSCPQAYDYFKIVIEPGEGSKNMAVVESVWQKMMDQGIDREAILICLGGGVVCDLGGYAASGFKRGIKTIYIPTTNLAMCDAAVGGKTGVNFSGVKNQIGSFHLPEIIYLNTEFLDTLNHRYVMSGFAETIKHALISDYILWTDLSLSNEPWIDTNIIQRSMNCKIEIVKQDFEDKGIRQSLNFGHTIGHAIEALASDTNVKLLHGEAIVIGMWIETWISNKLNMISDAELAMIQTYLEDQYKELNVLPFDIDQCIALMRQDKKNTGGQITFSLLKAIGSSHVGVHCDIEIIKEGLGLGLNAFKQ
jgi:3-dehydroquinate synthase